MRFHCLGVPHTITNEEYVACAFTQKVRKFIKMMRKRGHHCIHYGHERSETDANEEVAVTDDSVLEKAYGDYNWKRNFFKHSREDYAHKTFNARAGEEIKLRKQPGDFVLAFWGWGVKEACDANPDLLVVEPGIGYPDTFARFKIFESYALYHAYRGIDSVRRCNQDWYEFVVPNYFDPAEFEFRKHKSDYVLALGRIGRHKGTDQILQATKELGLKLVIAGQGGPEELGLTEWPDNVEYVGYAGIDKRKELMAGASAFFIGSTYIEPFGGVAVEAMFSGTPVICPPWGAFAETVDHGATGWKYQTYDQLLWALRNRKKLQPLACAEWAKGNYSLDVVGRRYEHVFRDIHAVWEGPGWYKRTERDYSDRFNISRRQRLTGVL
jgi:glycosyltransferase involved in cell wall biosynthesis